MGPVISQMRPASASFGGDKIAIVSDEGRAVARQCQFHHRMTAAFDDEVVAVVDLRARIVALGGEMGKRARNVEAGKRFGAFLDLRALRDHAGGEPLEDVELQPERAVGGAGDFGFQFAQLGGGEAHLAGERLAVDESGIERRGKQLVAVLSRDLDEIAEHVVVADFQSAHAGVVGVARLQRSDDAARFVAQRARLVERGVVALAHEAAVALEAGQFGGKRGGKLGGQHAVRTLARAQRVGDLRRRRFKRANRASEIGRGQDAVANGGEVARAAAANRQPRQRAGEIRCRGKP